MNEQLSEDPRAIAQKVIDYLMSPEGRADIAKANEASKELEEMFRKAREIPLEKLHEPFTI